MAVQLSGRAGFLEPGGPRSESPPRKKYFVTPLTYLFRCQNIIWRYAPYHAWYGLSRFARPVSGRYVAVKAAQRIFFHNGPLKRPMKIPLSVSANTGKYREYRTLEKYLLKIAASARRQPKARPGLLLSSPIYARSCLPYW